MKIRKLAGLGYFLLLLLAVAGPQQVMAQEEKAFAEHKFVLQISDMDPFKQTLVLNVANNILKAYGADQVDVEIVAFGPGLRLLFEDNANSSRIDGLAQFREQLLTGLAEFLDGFYIAAGWGRVV